MGRRDPFRDKVHAAFMKALESGITQAIVCQETGIDKSSMHQFKEKKRLGPEKLASVAAWLKRRGFMTDSLQPTRPDRPKPVGLPHQPLMFNESAPVYQPPRRFAATLDHECHACGQPVIGPKNGAGFCFVCGAAFLRQCPECEFGNDLDALYCKRCGAGIEAGKVNTSKG